MLSGLIHIGALRCQKTGTLSVLGASFKALRAGTRYFSTKFFHSSSGQILSALQSMTLTSREVMQRFLRQRRQVPDRYVLKSAFQRAMAGHAASKASHSMPRQLFVTTACSMPTPAPTSGVMDYRRLTSGCRFQRLMGQ